MITRVIGMRGCSYRSESRFRASPAYPSGGARARTSAASRGDLAHYLAFHLRDRFIEQDEARDPLAKQSLNLGVGQAHLLRYIFLNTYSVYVD